jgi:hypothetical protein
LLIGNLILAVVATIGAYVAVYRLLLAYESDAVPVIEETVEEFVETITEEHDVSPRDAE